MSTREALLVVLVRTRPYQTVVHNQWAISSTSKLQRTMLVDSRSVGSGEAGDEELRSST
jgi:hypothetical protein